MTKRYSEWSVNDLVRARLVSPKPDRAWYVEVEISTALSARQTENLIDLGMRWYGWKRAATESPEINGRKVIWFYKGETLGYDSWTPEERGENVREALDVFFTLNIGPVAMLYGVVAGSPNVD